MLIAWTISGVIVYKRSRVIRMQNLIDFHLMSFKEYPLTIHVLFEYIILFIYAIKIVLLRNLYVHTIIRNVCDIFTFI